MIQLDDQSKNILAVGNLRACQEKATTINAEIFYGVFVKVEDFITENIVRQIQRGLEIKHD